MKKFLRIVIIILVLLAAFVGIKVAMAPKDVNISRSITINAPKSVVFEQMTHFKQWPNWSPWHEMEPDMAITYSGTDGEAGSGYHWVGKKMGEGNMTATAITQDSMQYRLDFTKPMQWVADGYLVAHDMGNGTTQATWIFHTQPEGTMKVFAAVMNMDNMMGKDFTHGLDKLKKYSEAHATVTPATPPVKDTAAAVQVPQQHP